MTILGIVVISFLINALHQKPMITLVQTCLLNIFMLAEFKLSQG